MTKRTPGMYAYYKNEVVKALEEDYQERVGYLMSDMPYEILVALRDEQILPQKEESVDSSRNRTIEVEETWTITYKRKSRTRVGDFQMTEMSFPTLFSNGTELDTQFYSSNSLQVEEEGDRMYLSPDDLRILARN